MIMGASLNKSSVLIMRAEKVGKETIFSRIIQLVENTQNTKEIEDLKNVSSENDRDFFKIMFNVS